MTKEAAYLIYILGEISDNDRQNSMVVCRDHLSAQQLARNLVYNSRSKLIDIRYHFVRELIRNNVIDLKYIHIN